MTKKNDLIEAMDEAARELLNSVNGHTIEVVDSGEEPQPIDLKGRVAAFEAVTAYLAVKHKIAPEGAKSSGIDRYRSAINGSAAGRGGRGSKDAAALSGPDDAEAD